MADQWNAGGASASGGDDASAGNALPEGWVEYTDESSGHPYWYNEKTGLFTSSKCKVPRLFLCTPSLASVSNGFHSELCGFCCHCFVCLCTPITLRRWMQFRIDIHFFRPPTLLLTCIDIDIGRGKSVGAPDHAKTAIAERVRAYSG